MTRDVLREAMVHRDECDVVGRSGPGGGSHRRPKSTRRPHCLSTRPRAHGVLEVPYYDTLRAPSVLDTDDVLFLFYPSEPSAAGATTGRDLVRLRKWWAPWLMMYDEIERGVTLPFPC